MKKTITLFLFLFALSVQIFAQDRTVTGTVTSAQDKMGIPGVSVVEPGTTNGAVTDIDGKFSVNVKAETTQLKFSGTGLVTQTVDIPSTNVITISMSQDVQKLGEVVVTALGIKREEKSLGYSTQQVSGSELSTAKEGNFINSLQGKVAGVSITGNTNMGGSSRILLRGVRSINGENQPLFIVDGIPVNNENIATDDQVRGALGYDYGNAISDINPDDVESVNVLKGPAATALYGSRGANGVIIITTKKGVARVKGEGRSPIGVSVSTGITWGQVYNLPEYQNRYGGGASSEFVESDLHPGELRSNFEYDGSWGPELLGQEVYQWASYYPSSATYNQKTPWVAHPNNVKDFFETAMTTNNNIAIDGGNDKTLYRLSYTNTDDKGVIPNSSQNKNIVSFSGSNKFTDKLSSSISLNYVASRAKGRAATGYNSVASNFNQWWERQLDMGELKDYKNPDGTQRTWNMNAEDDLSPLYWDNPYWVAYENYETDQRNRLYGGLNLSYEIVKGIEVSGSVKTDYYNDARQERVAIGSASATAIPKYSENNITFNENNYELIVTGKKRFSEAFDLSGFLGFNRMDQKIINDNTTTQGGLNVPNFYSFLNSTSNLLTDDETRQVRKNSVFASVSLGYKSFLYLDVTGRNDWSSTLPENSNSYFYPSVTGSFVFSELAKQSWLSYGKIRAGWAQSAIDPGPYKSTKTLPVLSDNFNSFPTSVIPGTYNNTELRPELSTSWEAGVEAYFFAKRITLDVTYSSSLAKDVIFDVQQSASSGIRFKSYNAAEISNKTIELQLGVVPIRTKSGLEWGLGLNFAKTENMVEKLFTDENGVETQTVRIINAPFSASFEMRAGMEYGQIVGYDYTYDANGNKLIDDAGFYIPSETVKPLGSILPDYTGGISTYVSFKGIRLGGLVDFQKGGKVFSLTNIWGKYSGIFAETADNNIREDGVINEGIVESTGEQNTQSVAAVDHFFNDGGYVITAADVYDASYVKLREITLTYALPDKWFKKAIQGISIGIYGRNLAILHKNVPNIDPEAAVSTSNIQGLEGGQLPTSRTFGATLSFKF